MVSSESGFWWEGCRGRSFLECCPSLHHDRRDIQTLNTKGGVRRKGLQDKGFWMRTDMNQALQEGRWRGGGSS